MGEKYYRIEYEWKRGQDWERGTFVTRKNPETAYQDYIVADSGITYRPSPSGALIFDEISYEQFLEEGGNPI